ncbi:hypothetical protein B0A48_13227 [Cryoendolithus antarcticus]|uniref:Uncharacterized protein n=1 Tax=Cryoendolithus antarcticus TaxID=1507870 RepID=A0A1V8SNJ4_9PEZI|nr:hypothetical protein B0A48_13227 [Cryoendolithus antarcticus]
MGKRPRERDRPKAGPNAGYNPNKRILLSYDSEEETEVLDPVPVVDPRAVKSTSPTVAGASVRVSINGPFTKAQTQGNGGIAEFNIAEELPEEDDDYDPAALVMKSHGGDQVAGVSWKESVDVTPEDERATHASGKLGKNASTNQMPAIGSLAFQWDDESEDGGESEVAEAMAYLRAVRQERQSIPLVLKAPGADDDADIYEEGDSRGYFEDDCYIARPVMRPQPPLKATVSPMEAYTNALSNRFKKLRARLREPLDAKVTTNTTDPPTPLNPQDGNKAYVACINAVRKTTPSPSQLIAMSNESVFAMLELIDTHCLSQRKQIKRNTGAWVMALFARLDDVGTMDGDQVSLLRELGKKAVIVQLSFVNAAAATELEAVAAKEKYAAAVDGAVETDIGADAEHDASDVESEDAVTARTTGEADDTEHTLATLDMILTVVGEFFGQRDLLEFRRSWEPEV